MVQIPLSIPSVADPAGEQGAGDGWIFGTADNGSPIPKQRDAPFSLLPSDQEGIDPL
jgi:hypothetical protein